MKTRPQGAARGYGFGTFQGVFTPSILTIIGVVMYLRFGWMLGNVGLPASLLIVTIGSSITFLTGLSISALATNMRVKGGGAYFILSRSLGLEAGAALGIPLALSQAVSVSFYVAGFAEALVNSKLPFVAGWEPRIVGLATLAALALVSSISADLTLKSQYFIMAAIAFSLVSFFLGSPPDLSSAALAAGTLDEPLGFWPVFAVFFPAVTGILSGLGMSGDLKDPGKSIPRGTLAAVLAGYAIYMSVPIALRMMVDDPAVLRTDTMILQKCARWQTPVLLGIWAATLSSAVGSFLVAPRVLQALSRDRLLPGFLGQGLGRNDDPLLASAICFVIAALGIWFGDINILAPILTLFNLSTYGLLNLAAAGEETMGNPTWRPTFRVKAAFSFLGFAGCLAAMFMISPGWTFIALFCEMALYWMVKRRALRAQWGDMRAGVCAVLVRSALRRLMLDRHSERNWRPNLLVLSRLPIQRLQLLDFARGVSGGRSFVTIASVLPEGFAGSSREVELADSVRRTAERHSLEAEVKLLSAPDEWAGVAELVRTYGFGPITPNTVVLGWPGASEIVPFAGLVMQAVRHRKNVVIIAAASKDAPIAPDAPIDVWWRGSGRNGSLMLAIAYLLGRGGFGGYHTLRLNMIVRRRTREEAQAELDAFLSDVRLDAQTRVFDSGDQHFSDIICEHSRDSSCSLLGLRAPNDNETTAEYAAYFEALDASIATVPTPIFVLAAENVDFRRIFN